ncbi:hypothetical protein BDY17DRAFT_154511 [Neohortaea acidophila]|uniref:Uncharacterized protein n=1 Tax=Neohortaea acidophila TaxID=245834 RepID=A0A6A6PUL1_9PEZI|nr:uncharacterized protein BDY17DRAFT_154511 [Neohortaea acidophila]KAF2483780.1 hypothetical protein BDY17DRAFT_154511 [Neohortaea acidophila]
MAVDEPSAQLNHDLRHEIHTALATRRPLLHHLNADTSWLLQIPRPASAVRKGGRVYFNLLIDPWLAGGQSDVASWFSQQFHVGPSAVPTIAALEELAREIEILASGLQQNGRSNEASLENDPPQTFVDAVCVSHEFTDHCHKDTLLELHPDTPVFAIKEAARLIGSWKHFRTVVTVDSFGVNKNSDWRSTSIAPLPQWIGISRLLQTGDVLNYHSALMIAFNNQQSTSNSATGNVNGHHSKVGQDIPTDASESEDWAEAIVYTPHGIHSGDLNLIPGASPPIRTLAFLHGLHNVRVGTIAGRTALQSNLGAHNGLKAQRVLNAKYWIGTHDEEKTGGGLVSWFLQRDVITLQEALEAERQARADVKDVATLAAFEDTNWLELKNGESRVLI